MAINGEKTPQPNQWSINGLLTEKKAQPN